MLRKCIVVFVLILSLCGLTSCRNQNEQVSILKSEVSIEQYLDSTGAKVLFIYDKNNILYKFVVYGSTDYDEYGKDIVASALSVLSINTINSILSLTDIDIKYESTTLNDKPYLECYIDRFDNSEQKKEYNLFIESLKLGVKEIEELYGSQYVEVIEIK